MKYSPPNAAFTRESAAMATLHQLFARLHGHHGPAPEANAAPVRAGPLTSAIPGGRRSLFSPVSAASTLVASAVAAGVARPRPANVLISPAPTTPTPSDPDYSARNGDEIGRLSRLGFKTLPECLLSIPKGYYDYTNPIKTVGRDHEDCLQYLVLRAGETKLFDARKRVTGWGKSAARVQINCKDARGTSIDVVAFGNVWPWKGIDEGDVIHVYGTLTRFNGFLTLANPHPVPPSSRGLVVALYAGKSGQVSGETLCEGVSRAIHRLDDAEVLLLAQAGLRESEFVKSTLCTSPKDMLKSLHFPASVVEGERAMSVARTLSAETVVRRAAIAKSRPPVLGSAIVINKTLVDDLVSKLPFSLTGDQRVAIDEIVGDLRSAYAMNRLLSGDVGTGKSVVFMVPAAAAYAAGAEVAILVPSQLLVAQIAGELRAMFPGLPVCEVISGGKIGDGIVVGTTALISAARKAKKKFQFLITDEQHKFSVEQKAALAARFTNSLEATATAIPRTLALVNFGGMDVSVLRECPVVKNITTRIVRTDEQSRVIDFVNEVIRREGQVAIIYPIVEAAAKLPAAAGITVAGASSVGSEPESVVSAGAKWEARFPGRVGILHGKLTAEEKAGVIQGMNAGEFDVLVSSLVIEVGVTLPSLKAIIINHSEFFGLAQLHQLRGRVARKGGRGYMFLLADDDLEDDTMERLRLLERCSDGFELAEADMDLRGFGDVTDDSSSQTGSSRTLFHNAKLSHQEIAAAAKRLGFTL